MKFPYHSDDISPITLRQLRRLTRSYTLLWTTLLLLAVLIAAFCACSLFGNGHEMSLLLWTAATTQPLQVLLSFIVFLPGCMYVSAKINDEMLDIAFSPKEILHGYWWIGIILGCYYTALALPFVALSYVYGGPLLVSLWALFSGVLSLLAMSLIYFSWLAKVRSSTVMWLVAVFLYFFGALHLMGPMLAEIGLVSFGAVSGRAFAPMYGNELSWVCFTFFQFLALAVVAYRLSLLHLENPSRSVGVAVLINLGVYGLIVVSMSAIWAALRILQFI